MLKVAIVGAGLRGRMYATALADLPEVEVVRFVEPSPRVADAAWRETGIPTLPTHDELLAQVAFDAAASRARVDPASAAIFEAAAPERPRQRGIHRDRPAGSCQRGEFEDLRVRPRRGQQLQSAVPEHGHARLAMLDAGQVDPDAGGEAAGRQAPDLPLSRIHRDILRPVRGRRQGMLRIPPAGRPSILPATLVQIPGPGPIVTLRDAGAGP